MPIATRSARGAALMAAALLVAATATAAGPAPVAASAGGCDTVTMTSTDPLELEIEVAGCGAVDDVSYEVTAELFERRTSGLVNDWSHAGGGVAVLVDATRSVPVGGWYDLVVTSQSDTGGQVIQSAARFVGDGNRVTISRPVLQLRPGTMTSSTFPATVDWKRVGDATALRYKVQRSVDGGPFAAVATTTNTELAIVVSRGTRYEFRVRGIGLNGNAGPWRAAEARIPTGVGDSSAMVEYTGSWREVRDGAYWGNRAHVTGEAGRRARIEFTGSGAGVVTTMGPNQGSIRIYVDGEYRRTVKTYASRTAYRQVVYTVQWPEIGAHTLRIVVVGTDGHPRVDLDGFLVLTDLR